MSCLRPFLVIKHTFQLKSLSSSSRIANFLLSSLLATKSIDATTPWFLSTRVLIGAVSPVSYENCGSIPFLHLLKNYELMHIKWIFFHFYELYCMIITFFPFQLRFYGCKITKCLFCYTHDQY